MTDPALDRPPGPMPFFQLLDEALRRVRIHLRAIFPSVAIPLALLQTLFAVLQAVNVRQNLANPDIYQTLVRSGEVLLASLVLLGLSAVAYTAGQVASLDALAGRPVDMRRAWRFALQTRVWGTLLLVGLALFLAALCCVLPVFYVAPLLSFVVPVMVGEGVFGPAALSRSAELTRFNPGGRLGESPIVKILLLMLVSTLITYLGGLLVTLPFQIPMFIDFFRKIMTGEDLQAAVSRWIWLQVPARFLGSLIGSAVYLYTAFGLGLLFFDARGRKEGGDLRAEIDAVFPPPPPPPPGEPWP
jgi:hypothetical protein